MLEKEDTQMPLGRPTMELSKFFSRYIKRPVSATVSTHKLIQLFIFPINYSWMKISMTVMKNYADLSAICELALKDGPERSGRQNAFL